VTAQVEKASQGWAGRSCKSRLGGQFVRRRQYKKGVEPDGGKNAYTSQPIKKKKET